MKPKMVSEKDPLLMIKKTFLTHKNQINLVIQTSGWVHESEYHRTLKTAFSDTSRTSLTRNRSSIYSSNLNRRVTTKSSGPKPNQRKRESLPRVISTMLCTNTLTCDFSQKTKTSCGNAYF